MRALQLFSPALESTPNSGACLLVYAEPRIHDTGISSDIREIYNNRPSTSHIYVLAPFCNAADLVSSIRAGTSLRRARPYIQEGGSFNILSLSSSENELEVVSTQLSWVNDEVQSHATVPLSRALQNAWLFDLFDRNGGRVAAPAGVHFRKGSGKHTDKFLRTANVLLSSNACGVLAFFSLPQFGKRAPRQILVDTAPLISVAQAIHQISVINELWSQPVPIKSFSSYGGLESLPRQSQSDLALISASTSGALADALVERGISRNNVTTLFFLASGPGVAVPTGTVCDLTYRPGQHFGYSAIENFNSQTCPLCKKGHILAELEGDQFLFQKRGTLRIKIKRSSQAERARAVVEILTRKNLLKIQLQPNSGDATTLRVAADELIKEDETRIALIRQIRRFGPAPLSYIVLDDISEESVRDLLNDAKFYFVENEVKFIHWSSLATAPTVAEGGALVIFGLLHDHARARQINATLRRVLPRGTVTYVSALTVAESPDDLFDLKMFLEYGEHGRDTFIFRTAHELAYPSSKSRSAWSLEHDLITEICAEGDAPNELTMRLKHLNENQVATSELFFCRPDVKMAINNDFVYLDTKYNKDRISDADVCFVIASALASARCRDLQINSGRNKDGESRVYSSLYGHALLCPENFRNYNDSILKAALLRFASTAELWYAADEGCSREILEVILDELAGWKRGDGDALPEFLIALACERLTLDERHLTILQHEIVSIKFPEYIASIIKKINF